VILTNFCESTTLIIDIPPKLRGNKEDFIGKIQLLIPYIEKSSIKMYFYQFHICLWGSNDNIVTEETDLKPESEGGRQLVIVEKLLQMNSRFKTTVLRFGGLIGEDRNPYILAGRKTSNPNAPVNLIHQEDCIGIIQNNSNKYLGETYNASTPFILPDQYIKSHRIKSDSANV
jgi:hypothetical protein